MSLRCEVISSFVTFAVYDLRSSLTCLAVTLSVTRRRVKMQKTVTVTPRLTQSTDTETDGHGGVITAWTSIY